MFSDTHYSCLKQIFFSFFTEGDVIPQQRGRLANTCTYKCVNGTWGERKQQNLVYWFPVCRPLCIPYKSNVQFCCYTSSTVLLAPTLMYYIYIYAGRNYDREAFLNFRLVGVRDCRICPRFPFSQALSVTSLGELFRRC